MRKNLVVGRIFVHLFLVLSWLDDNNSIDLMQMPERTCPSRLTRGISPEGRQKIIGAYHFAWQYLSLIQRRTRVSYAEHGKNVALALREITTNPSLLAVALIHDIFLLPDGATLLAKSGLNRKERDLARAMHELRRLHIDANTKDLDRAIDAFSRDEHLIILRMAHRLNDVRHLDLFNPTLQQAIAHETLHMYTSIAGRLGMHAWRHEMEEACFRFLQPKVAHDLERKMKVFYPLDVVCVQHAKRFLMKRFRGHSIPCRLSYRIKGLYSTYRKIVLKNRRFEELTDRLALRLIVQSVEDCYRALGIVHGVFHPIPGKLKDYIGAPKENGYRSIHTVVYPLRGVTEQPMEIQIRTEEMHKECEFGIAGHVDYKHYLYVLQAAPTRVQLFRNLLSLRAEARSPEQFAKALRTYFDDGHIAVFDSQNNLYHLKKPVAASEFITQVYGKSSSLRRTVRINGREQLSDTPLRDGDTVEMFPVKRSHHSGSSTLDRTRRTPSASISPSNVKPDPRR